MPTSRAANVTASAPSRPEAVGGGKVIDANDTEDSSDDVNGSDANDALDADGRALSAAERASAEKAALNAVGNGTITDLDASDDRGEAYGVDVRKANGTDWDVTLDAELKVLDKSVDS
jgi:uncharacterized membrane protein YkoI